MLQSLSLRISWNSARETRRSKHSLIINVQKTLFNSHHFCFLILDPFRALVTRDEERSNLDKVSWKSEIIIETPFRETNVVAASCKRHLKNHSYGG